MSNLTSTRKTSIEKNIENNII
jgi:isopentenyl phosphate kinase